MSLSRREFVAGLSGATALWLAGAIACRERAEPDSATHALPADAQAPPRVLRFLTEEEAREVEAVAARIIPTDETPGAREAGVVWFIDGALDTFFADQQAMVRPALAKWAAEVGREHPGVTRFSDLGEADQDAFLRAREKSDLFEFLRAGTVFGMFALPKYGGNADFVGWRLIGQDHVYEYTPPFGWYDHPDNQRALLGRVL